MSIALGMLALGGAILVDARTDAWSQAQQASNNLALALSRDILRTVTMLDLSIQGARAALSRPDLDQVSPETWHMTLFNQTGTDQYLGALLILNANGDIVADSTSIAQRNINLADREHFKIHQENADAGLFVSRPYRSRMRDGDLSVSVSRRINRPDGSFGGVVVGTLRLAYFSNLFGKLDLGSNGSVSLFRADGRVIMRRPFREGDIDRDLGNTSSFQRYLEAPSGSLIGRATLDGIDRLYAFRHLENLPLILSVAVSMEDVYAAWWKKAFGIGAVLTLLCGSTVVLSLLFRREMLRRISAEQGLHDAIERLALIASTDALTGLANRRTFEERFSLEWLRAIRTEQPIALLLLDADCFKLYNDTYGHPEGDQVLRAIAACIAANVKRPTDLGARYGGEEFVVILPDTEMAGALFVAERLRAAVSDLSIVAAGSPCGHVTVSIGVAVAHPSHVEAQSSLIALADKALYDAKHAGRNQVRAAGLDKLHPIVWQGLLATSTGHEATQ